MPGRMLICTMLALFIAALAGDGFGAQGPTSKNPRLPLPVAFVRELGAYCDTAAQLDEEIVRAVSQMQTLSEHGKIKEVDGLKIEETYGQIRQLQQIAERLNGWGEPAGADLESRSAEFNGALYAIAKKRAQLSDFKIPLAKRLKKLDAELQKVKRDLPTIQKLLDRKQADQAQRRFWELTDSLERGAYWFQVTSSRPASMQVLTPIRNACSTAAHQYWSSQAQKIAAAEIAARDTDFPRLTQRAQAAALAVAQRPKIAVGVKKAIPPARAKHPADKKQPAAAPPAEVEINESQLIGPAEIGAIGQAWQQAQGLALQARGWSWYIRRLGGTDNVAAMESAQQIFHRNMAGVMAEIVTADAKRATAAEAPALYRAYLAKLSPLFSLSTDPALASPFEQPLGALADRAPEFYAEVQAYHDATDDLLRWRSRAASAALHAHLAQCPTVEQVAMRLAGVTDNNIGPFFIDQRLVAHLTASGNVPKLILRLSHGMESKQAAALDLLGTPGSTKAIGVFRRPLVCYASVPPAATAEAFNSLETDLLASDTQPPLTLRARLALDGARQGDLVGVAGPITRVGLLSSGEHFADLPLTQRGMVRLEPLTTEPSVSGELVVLVLIDAQWLAGRYYFVAPQAAAPESPVPPEK